MDCGNGSVGVVVRALRGMYRDLTLLYIVSHFVEGEVGNPKRIVLVVYIGKGRAHNHSGDVIAMVLW